MHEPYRWGDLAPPAAQRLKDRRRQREVGLRVEPEQDQLAVALRELLAEIRQSKLSWIDE